MCWGYGHTPPCWAELQVCDSTAQEGLKLREGNHKNTVEKPGWAVGLLSLALLLTDSPAALQPVSYPSLLGFSWTPGASSTPLQRSHVS